MRVGVESRLGILDIGEGGEVKNMLQSGENKAALAKKHTDK
jgi:hypothetical protein